MKLTNTDTKPPEHFDVLITIILKTLTFNQTKETLKHYYIHSTHAYTIRKHKSMKLTNMVTNINQTSNPLDFERGWILIVYLHNKQTQIHEINKYQTS